MVEPNRLYQTVSKGPYGIRTRAAAVRGRCPRPLDEWAAPGGTSLPTRGGSTGYTATLTGNVRIQITAPAKIAQPRPRMTAFARGAVSLVLIPAKKSATAKRTTQRT